VTGRTSAAIAARAALAIALAMASEGIVPATVWLSAS
jgi:hypothetical protein